MTKFKDIELIVLPTLTDNYTYLLLTPNELWVIDPGEAPPVLGKALELGRQVTHIICTHHHHDHVGGVMEIKRQTRARVLTSPVDFTRIEGADAAWPEAQKLQIGGLSARSIMIPGHTMGHMAIYLKEPGWLFCGDTLFGMGCGRLFEGTPAQLHESLQKLKALPPETKIYWGHEYTQRNLEFTLTQTPGDAQVEARAKKIHNKNCTLPGVLSEELETNLFLKASVEQFARLRELRNNF